MLSLSESIRMFVDVGPRKMRRSFNVLGINPEEYLTDVLTRLPGMLAEDTITLTLANWLKARGGKPFRVAA